MLGSLIANILCIVFCTLILFYLFSNYYTSSFQLYRGLYNVQQESQLTRALPLTFTNNWKLIVKLFTT
jgi:hypothetical protein